MGKTAQPTSHIKSLRGSSADCCLRLERPIVNPSSQVFPLWGILLITFGVLLLVMLIAGLLLFRHYRLEAELAAMTWRIRWEELSGEHTRRAHTAAKAAVTSKAKAQPTTNHTGTEFTSTGAPRSFCHKRFAFSRRQPAYLPASPIPSYEFSFVQAARADASNAKMRLF